MTQQGPQSLLEQEAPICAVPAGSSQGPQRQSLLPVGKLQRCLSADLVKILGWAHPLPHCASGFFFWDSGLGTDPSGMELEPATTTVSCWVSGWMDGWIDTRYDGQIYSKESFANGRQIKHCSESIEGMNLSI